VEAIFEGGFRIDIEPDQLTVVRDAGAAAPSTGTIAVRLLAVVCVVAVALKILFDAVPAFGNSPPSVLAFVVILIGIGVLWAWHSKADNIHCSRKRLEIVRAVRGRIAARRAFPRSHIRQIGFTAISWSTSGPRFAIVFKVNGREVEVLRGIESPEAQTVLRELDRLGYDVDFDVGMPTLVQMAIERRRNPEE
jgi:hypothetical protein